MRGEDSRGQCGDESEHKANGEPTEKEETRERQTGQRRRRRALMAVRGGVSCLFPQTQVPDPHPYTIGAGGTSQEQGSTGKGTTGSRTQQPRAPSEGRRRQDKRGERERTEEKTRERREGKKRQTERQMEGLMAQAVA